ncbi:MAG: DUF995 domain-containing protein [Sulfitobacter sp.]
MRKFESKLTIVALLASLAAPALADPKPSGAKPPDAQALANLYAGRSETWKSCKGGVYFGGKWEAQAYCARDGESVGLGKWSVSRNGKICHQMSWYWPKGDKTVGSKVEDTKCIAHLVDAQGTIWRNWEEDNDWWRMDVDKKKRFELKGKVTRLRRKLNV